MGFSPIKSPVPVTLEFDDEIIPPLSEEMLALFESPVKPISPLPSTPKKRKIEVSKPSEKTKSMAEEKKLSDERNRHLLIPKKDDLKDKKKRGCCPGFVHKRKAKRGDMFSGSIIPDGIGGVKKVEKAILPDGTIYELSAYWMPEPTCTNSIRPPSPPIEEKEEAIYVAEPVEGNYVETTVVVVEGIDSEEETNREEDIQGKETEEKGTQTETSTKDMSTQSGEIKILF
ncbi:unnamed protein product [Mytilus coruscus]|uniref:Uncharacterized protein n=1 Tax=Mytilus coruscus TaxID=42192 RepID=A0A6J8DFS7_MYTCO|nr:unnamed protein product [Mytilus coruscus]